MALLESLIDPVSDKIDTSIPICRIKTPIPNIPAADLCLDVLLKIAASGKIELLISNSFELGFETKNGQVRYINDHSSNVDTIIQASGKAAMGLNVALEALSCRLADMELDGGIALFPRLREAPGTRRSAIPPCRTSVRTMRM